MNGDLWKGINNKAVFSQEEKRRELFLQQKHTLDLFLERSAISKQQYDKSLGDLREKMGMQGVE